MKMKKLFSCLLIAVMTLCFVLTGCSSSKDTMFNDMKKISRIKNSEFSCEGDVTIKSEDDDVQYHFTLDGKTNGQSATMGLSFSSGVLTITLDDFIRMTDNTLYMNMSWIFSSMLGLDGIDGTDLWVSTPVTTDNDEVSAIQQSFTESFIDSLEKVCKEQSISKDGDTWTLDIPADKIISFAQSALDEIDSNFSSWYDLYMELAEKTGTSDIMNEYSAFTEDSEDDATLEDNSETASETEESSEQTQAQKKEEALDNWKELSASLQESLTTLEEAITNEKATASCKMTVSLTGSDGSQSADESVDFNMEDSESGNSFSMSLKETVKELEDAENFTVEAPDEDSVMTLEEFSQIFSSLAGSYDDDPESYYDSGLTDEEKAEILPNLEDNQVYLYNSDEEEMSPYVVTFDSELYTPSEQIANYGIDFDINGTQYSYACIYYDTGNLENDLKEYYLDEDDKTSTLTTDAGDLTIFTTPEPDDMDYYTSTFGMQLDENSYIVGFLEIEKSETVDVDTYVKGLLKELKPYEVSSSDSNSL